MARGTWSGIRAYQTGKGIQQARSTGAKSFLEAQQQFNTGVAKFRDKLQKDTPDWFSEPTLQFNSVPFYVADILKRGVKAGLSRVPVRSAGGTQAANLLYLSLIHI